MGVANVRRVIATVVMRHLEWQKAVINVTMGKSCCAVGCTKRYYKGCGVHFYRFPKDSRRRNLWIASVNRKDWEPTEHTWICSSHFVGGVKSDDPSSPAYVPTLTKL